MVNRLNRCEHCRLITAIKPRRKGKRITFNTVSFLKTSRHLIKLSSGWWQKLKHRKLIIKLYRFLISHSQALSHPSPETARTINSMKIGKLSHVASPALSRMWQKLLRTADKNCSFSSFLIRFLVQVATGEESSRHKKRRERKIDLNSLEN